MSRIPTGSKFSISATEKENIIILDLDNFQNANDTFGCAVGDEVLVRATEIINENVRDRGIVGRMGGNEIMIVTSSIEEQTELRNTLRSIRTSIE